MISDTAAQASGASGPATLDGGPSPGTGALLTDAQIVMLRRAVIVMTALLVAGVVLLIGRIIYLARGPSMQAASAITANTVLAPTLLPEVRLALPQGAEIRHLSLAGSRLAINHAQPGGSESITILDLATGVVIARVMLTRGN